MAGKYRLSHISEKSIEDAGANKEFSSDESDTQMKRTGD